MKIYGINHVKGEYQGHQYDNLQLFGTTEVNGVSKWVMEKCPMAVVTAAGFQDYTLMVGNDIEIFYNKFGKVSSIRIM